MQFKTKRKIIHIMQCRSDRHTCNAKHNAITKTDTHTCMRTESDVRIYCTHSVCTDTNIAYYNHK